MRPGPGPDLTATTENHGVQVRNREIYPADLRQHDSSTKPQLPVLGSEHLLTLDFTSYLVLCK